MSRELPSDEFMRALIRHTFAIPADPHTAGPTVPFGWRECQCGRHCDPNMAKHCQAKNCEALICTTCQEDYGYCVGCGEPFCVDHSRPNPEGKGRICAKCDG